MERRALAETRVIPAEDSTYVNAVMGRDHSFDGVFVYGVSSTLVYCRPSCPARRPRPDKLVFFPNPSAAESSGYRACMRCKPQQPGPRIRQAELASEICDFIRTNFSRKLTLATLAAQFSISPYHLQRTFKRAVGVSPRQYLEEYRISKLKTYLSKGRPVVGALYGTGYNSQSWLYRNSTRKLGMTPGTYRRGGMGMRIGYLTDSSPLGRLLVAATEHGICAVSLANSDEELVAALHKEYPKATISKSEDTRRLLRDVLKFFEGQLLSLPLDLRGTDFQRKVWAALQTIPYGSTSSYSDVARMIGEPRAVRAVANACGDNPVPLIIPCHRVIRKDGSLGGYGLGIHRKRQLLAMESRPRSTIPK